MASIVAWLIGLLLLGLGIWILMLRFEGLIDRISPHNMLIGEITIDGTESKGHAELLRARFDHHFRRPAAIAKDTGFLEVMTLDTPELFQQDRLQEPLKKMTVEVSGVDVGVMFRLVNQLAQPDRWVIEGDFQLKPDRALLALRMRRGPRLIRTWYLERIGAAHTDDAMLVEQLIDDAIFQLAYDFGNAPETDKDFRKWRNVLPLPTNFPSREAVAAYYEGRSALGRYYAYGQPHDLTVAVDRLRTLRTQMPKFDGGLTLLGIALAEARQETEAIHVYEQLELLLLPRDRDIDELNSKERRHYLSVNLLKATARAKLDSWQSTHQAISELRQLVSRLDELVAESTPTLTANEGEAGTPGAGAGKAPHGQCGADETLAAWRELRAQAYTQLAYAFALYFSFMRHHMVADMFGIREAPEELRVDNPETLRKLREQPPHDEVKQIVIDTMKTINEQYERWIQLANEEKRRLEGLWCALADGVRRKSELTARLNLAAGYAEYRMAELEGHRSSERDSLLGSTYMDRLDKAAQRLTAAEAAHPNHYLVLQFLGLVYAEPRRNPRDWSIAEQYVERAIAANPADYMNRILHARVIVQQIGYAGLGINSYSRLQVALAEAEEAIRLGDPGGRSHLIRAQILTLLLKIERNQDQRRDLRAALTQSFDQAARFLPLAYDRPDVELSWLRIVHATSLLDERAQATAAGDVDGEALFPDQRTRFAGARKDVIADLDSLIKDCTTLSRGWVARQRVFLVNGLARRAADLKEQIENSALENWKSPDVQIL